MILIIVYSFKIINVYIIAIKILVIYTMCLYATSVISEV